jgi:hypothetical protein
LDPNDIAPTLPDLPHEPDYMTDKEDDDESSVEEGGEAKPSLPIKYEIYLNNLFICVSSQSHLPNFYEVRRSLLAADRYAASIVRKLAEKQSKLKVNL